MSFRLWFPSSARFVRFLMCICLNASRRFIIENAYILMMKLFVMVGLFAIRSYEGFECMLRALCDCDR